MWLLSLLINISGCEKTSYDRHRLVIVGCACMIFMNFPDGVIVLKRNLMLYTIFSFLQFGRCDCQIFTRTIVAMKFLVLFLLVFFLLTVYENLFKVLKKGTFLCTPVVSRI